MMPLPLHTPDLYTQDTQRWQPWQLQSPSAVSWAGIQIGFHFLGTPGPLPAFSLFPFVLPSPPQCVFTASLCLESFCSMARETMPFFSKVKSTLCREEAQWTLRAPGSVHYLQKVILDESLCFSKSACPHPWWQPLCCLYLWSLSSQFLPSEWGLYSLGRKTGVTQYHNLKIQ